MTLATLARTTLTCGFGLTFLLLTCNVQPALGQPYVISTLAGGAPPPTPLAAVSASIPQPSGVAVDSSGNAYFTSNNAVFKIDAAGSLTRVAGNSRAGYSGDGGPATSAQLDTPYGVAVDTSGNLYIADSSNHRIRKVAPGGTITTVAGTGTAGYSSDGVAATTSQLNNPFGIAVDSSGNLYIADSFNQRVRKVVPSGTITTVAGDGTCCYSGDNIPATKAQLYQPEGVAVDASGNLYIADLGNYRIRKVSPSGVISTVAGTGSPGSAGDGGSAASAQLQFPWTVALDTSGSLYIADNDRIRKVLNGAINTVAGTQITGFFGDGGPATKAQFNQPVGVAVDVTGNLYVADTGNNRIRKVLPSGVVNSIAGDGTHNYSGDGGPAISAQLYNPQAVALGGGGTLYISDYARLRKVSSNNITTVAQLNQPEGIAFDPASNNIYVADSGAGNRVAKISPGGAITALAGSGAAGAPLKDPEGLAVDAFGNVYIADSGNSVILRVTPTGSITTIAGNGTQGYSGDGGAATSAQLSFPRGLAVDASGNLYIADFGNSRIRKVTASGIITTVAGSGASDSSGDGGPATSAGISPQGVAIDTSGNLYIADFNNLVWKVSPSGAIMRIAGNGTPGYSGDGGSAVNAQLTDVRSVAVDSAGRVYLADTSNYAVRLLQPVAVLLSVITSPPLAPASVNAPYSQQLAAAGGTPPYTWSLARGTLPAGLTLSSTGAIAGTPSVVGASTFTVQVADAISSIATQTFSLTITTPAITTNSPLLQGTVGMSYSQTLSAAGGALPYSWTIVSGSLPQGLSLSSAGIITGTPVAAGTSNFIARLTDAASISTTQSFTLIVIAAPPLTRSGVLAHIAAGNSWTTTIYLANTSASQVAVALAVHADDGTALNLPMTVTQQGVTQSVTAPSLNTVISPNSTLVVDTGQQMAALVTGWVDLLSSGPVNGFAIFRTASDTSTSEGTSPLQTQFQSRIDVPYDNRAGFITAVALANLSPNAATVTATIWDPTGTQLGVQSISLMANGHTSFLLPTLFPQTSAQQGIVQFQSSAGNLAGLGLRASPQGTFTSVPIIEP